MLKITWGAIKSQCPGCTPTRLLQNLWAGAQATALRAAPGAPVCWLEQCPARMGVGGSDRLAEHTLGGHGRGGNEKNRELLSPQAPLGRYAGCLVLFTRFLQIMKPRLRNTQHHIATSVRARAQTRVSLTPDAGLLPPLTSCQITEELAWPEGPLRSVQVESPPGGSGRNSQCQVLSQSLNSQPHDHPRSYYSHFTDEEMEFSEK